MSVANTALVVAELDFFKIKENFKTFLRSQEEYNDYDFDGSGLSVLIDQLAYNTYYNGFYMNMLANEAYLDTAQIRKNVLSHAKAICYVPESSQGALSKVNITVTPSNSEDKSLNVLTLDKYTRIFGRDIDGVNYPFVTINSNTVSKSADSFNFANVIIKQGEVVTLQYPVDVENTARRYDIPSPNVDTTTVVVTVQQSSSNTTTTQYNLADDLTEITGDMPIYYLEENENLNYTVYFGDGILGKKPSIGNIVIISYLETVGAVSNNIAKFVFADPIGGKFRDNIVISTVRSSYGGTDKEDPDSIRFRAPYFYTAQNRAVTENDYQSLVAKDYNNIDSIAVWGGEKNDPVVYGKVFMSLKTKGYYALTNIEKEQIKATLIRNRNILTIIPEIVDPDYVFILVRGNVVYDPSLTSRSAEEIKTLVKQAIVKYNQDELSKFKSVFRKSKLQYYIENCEPSITGSDIDIFLQKRITVILSQSHSYNISYNVPLRRGDYNNKLYSYPQIQVADANYNLRNVFIEEVPDSFTGVDSIKVINPGMYYDSAPKVDIIGDGTGATAIATLVSDKVKSITVTKKGINYSKAIVLLSGGGGSQATAEAVLEKKNGLLRTYYYKDTGERVIVNDNVGTIDYSTGKVEIKNLTGISVLPNDYYDTNIVTLNAVPDADIILPSRNRILSIDENNFESIAIEMIAET